MVGILGPSSSERAHVKTEQVDTTKNHSMIFLILGIDSSGDDPVGRSDALFLATLNPYQKSVMLTTIPRDTYVRIPGKGSRDKINHSYMVGGEQLTKRTVEQFLKVPIDGYVKMDMNSLKTVVDCIGRIEVNVPFDFTYNGCRFYKGKMKLNGQQALAFSRMRKKDPEGDRGRNKRHQEVMKAIIKKGTSPYVMLRIIPIVQELRKKVSTDISTFTMLQLIYTYHDVSMSNVITNRLEGTGILMQGIYYYMVKDDEVKRLRNAIYQYQRNEHAL